MFEAGKKIIDKYGRNYKIIERAGDLYNLYPINEKPKDADAIDKARGLAFASYLDIGEEALKEIFRGYI